MSIKSTIAAVAASPFLFAGAAFAGPYVNVESNISYPDGDYSGATTDLHIGYEGSISESADFYVQGGPSFVAVDGTDGSEGEFSGKVGVNVAATDSVGVYGELSGKGGISYAATEDLAIYGELSGIGAEVNNDDQINWGAKLGAKFVF